MFEQLPHREQTKDINNPLYMLPVKLKKKEKIGNENTDKSFVTVPVFNIKEKLTDKTAFSKPGLQLFLWHLHNYVFPQQAKKKKEPSIADPLRELSTGITSL